MTTPASIIGDTRMDSSLEIVYMLRRYELMRDFRRIVAPSPQEETPIRQDEFFTMMKAFKKSPEDRLWGTLRDKGMVCRLKYFNPMRRLKSTSTKAPSSPQDEDAKRTLMNMLNMLSWYQFDSRMKASTSTSAQTIATSTSHKPSLSVVSAALTLNYIAPNEVLKPLANPNVRTRFEVFTAYVHVTRDPNFDDCALFGGIEVSDYSGSVLEGWGVLYNLGPGHVKLLSNHCCDSVKMQNNIPLKICNPSSRHSVSFSSSMRIIVLLYATTKDEADFFQVCNLDDNLDFSTFLESDSQISREYVVAEGDDGHIRINCI